MRTLLLTVLLAGGLFGQEPGLADRLVRADDLLVFECDGPAALRTAFLPTNVGSMLAAKEAADFRALVADASRRAFEEIAGEHAPDRESADALLDVLLAYRGRVRFGLAARPREAGDPELDSALVLGGGDRSGVAGLGEALRQQLDAFGRNAREIEVDGRSVTVLDVGDMGVSLPVEIDGDLAIFIGSDVESTVRRRLAAGPEIAFRPDAELRSAALGLELSVPVLFAITPDLDARDRAVAEACGLPSVRSFRMTARPNGPYVEMESSVGFVPDAPRGILAGLMPDSEEPPRLAALAPNGVDHWHAGKVRLVPLYRGILDAMAAWSEDEGGADRIDADVDETVGLDFEGELLAHVADDFLIASRVGGDDDDSGESILALRLADPAKFADAWRRVLDSESLSLGHETVTRGDFEVQHAILGWFAWAIDGDLIVLSASERAVDSVFAFLEHRAGPGNEAETEGALPAPIRRSARAAPPGMQGAGAFDVDLLLARPVWAMLGLDEWLPQDEDVAETLWLTELRELIAAQQLGDPVAFSAWHEHRWTYRVLW